MDARRFSKNSGDRSNLPSIEDGGLDDRTIASPSFGYHAAQHSQEYPQQAEVPYQAPTPAPAYDAFPDQAPEAWPSQAPRETLSRDEVAAVSMDREYYVSDVPSPYLSSKQASEDVRQTRRRHTMVVTAVVIALIVAAIAAAIWFVLQFIESQKVADVAQYETKTIERGEFLDTVDTTTLVRPINEQAVVAETSGTLAEVAVADGTFVEEGDVLFRLENKTITDALNKATDAYNVSRADAEAKAAALDRINAAVAAAQAEAAAKPNDAAAQAALNAAQALVPAAKAEFEAASTTLQTIQQTMERAQAQNDLLTITAPVAGTATEFASEAKVGTAIKGSTKLCTVSDTSRFCIEIELVDEAKYMVGVGDEVRLSFPSIEDLTMTVDVASVDDDGTRCMATVNINEPDERIVKGTAVEARIILQSIPDSLIVPLEAVRYDQNGQTTLDVLLDPSRGIKTTIPVTVTGTNKTQAAVKADNIQAGTSVIVVNHESTE